MSSFNRHFRYAVMLGLSCCSSQAFATSFDPAESPSISQMVHYGLTLNPRVRSAVAEIQQAEKTIDVNEGRFWPSLDLTAGPADGISGAFAYNITLSYTLYDWGALDSELEGMNAEARKALHKLRQVRAEVGIEIIEAYLDIMLAQQRQAIIQEHQRRIARVERMAEIRAAGGYSDRAELNRVLQARYYNEQQRQMTDGDQQQARLRLRMLMQRPVTALPPLPANYVQLQNLLPSTQQQTQLIPRSPQYMQAQEEVHIAHSQAERVKAAQLPRVVLEASSQRRDIGGELTRDSAVAVRFKASFNQGLASFDMDDIERLRAEAAQWDLQFTQLDIERNLNMQRESLRNLSQQRQSLEQQVNAATALLSAYQDQFRAGLTTVEEILTTERERFELLSQHLNVSIELLRIPYRMSSELGILESVLAAQSNEAHNL
ncbi:TolC family protein [Pseudoalteromonas sp. T1lg22]|uniref:TolC family protein n=1 Tax=Pseudoalteromonas sp. T1lg22 TaxID=2077096 RepID=UPI001F34B8CA|nr:TolC family protein [Pseudoalteromonas sp. T1lg22]